MYVKTPKQKQASTTEPNNWGEFVSFIEYGSDNYANKAIHIFENGFLTRYDRTHWQDQHGALPNFRLGKNWLVKWGEPIEVSAKAFQELWLKAELSTPFKTRAASPSTPCLWIQRVQMGNWHNAQ